MLGGRGVQGFWVCGLGRKMKLKASGVNPKLNLNFKTLNP